MSLDFFLVVHLIGVFMVLMPLGGIASHMMSGGTRANFVIRKRLAIIHGLGLLITIVAGMGLLAKLGFTQGMPGFAKAKFAIWLALGAAPVGFYRMPRAARALMVLVFLLAALAAYLGVYKPF